MQLASTPRTGEEGWPADGAPESATFLVFSGDFDRVMAALMIANAAAASGAKVSLYFSFWGLLALKRRSQYRGKWFIHQILTGMLSSGIDRLRTSRLNFGGIGPRLFGYLIKKKRMQTPKELLAMAQELGVRLVVCPASMDVMGISEDELIPGLEIAGVTAYFSETMHSKCNLVF